MQESPTAGSSENATEVLIELHEQLIRYKTAIESIDGAAASTQQAADAIAAIAAKLDGLQNVEAQISGPLRGALESVNQVQSGAEATRNELNAVVDDFAKRLNATAYAPQGGEIDDRIGEALLQRNDEIEQEVRRLRMFSMLNTLLVAILLLWLVFGQNPSTSEGEIANQESVQTPVGATPASENSSEPQQEVVEALNVQILNGCGIRGAARQVEDALAQYGISVQSTGNADHFNYEATGVFAGEKNQAQAARIVSILGLPNPESAVSLSQWGDFHVTIVIGKDFPQWAQALR